MEGVGVLQRGARGKQNALRILEFLFLCLLFYKYPPVLSGA